MEDVRVVIAYAAGVVRAGLAAPDAAQARALASTALAVAAAWLLVALAVPRGRRVVVDVLETVLAVVLIAMLLAVVLLLPLGAPDLARARRLHASFPLPSRRGHARAIHPPCCRHLLPLVEGSRIPV